MSKLEFNNIYLGDAYKLIKELPDKSIDLIVTDPPYDIPNIHGSGIMKTRKAGNFMNEIEGGGVKCRLRLFNFRRICQSFKKDKLLYLVQ